MRRILPNISLKGHKTIPAKIGTNHLKCSVGNFFMINFAFDGIIFHKKFESVVARKISNIFN